MKISSGALFRLCTALSIFRRLSGKGGITAGSKEETLFMFGDSIRHPEPKYRFSGEESKWFQVSFAENHVMVQVDGQDDRIVITGLINPRLKLFIKHTLSEEAQKTL